MHPAISLTLAIVGATIFFVVAPTIDVPSQQGVSFEGTVAFLRAFSI